MQSWGLSLWSGPGGSQTRQVQTWEAAGYSEDQVQVCGAGPQPREVSAKETV